MRGVGIVRKCVLEGQLEGRILLNLGVADDNIQFRTDYYWVNENQRRDIGDIETTK